MTNEQYIRYQAALITGYTSGIGGPTWTLYRPAGAGVTAAVTFTNEGSRTCYIIREKLVQWGPSAPGQPVGATQWRLNAPVGEDILSGDVVGAGGYFFNVGTLELDQGFPTGIVTPTGEPQVSTASRGFRSPLWILGIGAS